MKSTAFSEESNAANLTRLRFTAGLHSPYAATISESICGVKSAEEHFKSTLTAARPSFASSVGRSFATVEKTSGVAIVSAVLSAESFVSAAAASKPANSLGTNCERSNFASAPTRNADRAGVSAFAASSIRASATSAFFAETA